MSVLDKDIELIMVSVELYCDGHYYADFSKLEKVFYESSRVIGYVNDELLITSRDEYIERRKRFSSSMELGESKNISVISIDKVGAAAVVKLESSISGNTYASFLSMLKVGGDWKIVNGLFHKKDS